MKKSARKGPKRTAPTTGALLPLLHAMVRRDLREFVVDAGMAALADVLEEERAAACGPRYAHLSFAKTRSARDLWGFSKGSKTPPGPILSSV
ncbi:MAG TPA: hypothetical protein VFG23_03635 [Polyangia bacterium]|nr:hypothetical protein [Polyangia bacterium]